MNVIRVKMTEVLEASHLGLLSYGRDYGWLRESISKNGLMEPIIVCPNGWGRYTLVCGRARLEALRALGAGTVLVTVRTGLEGSRAFELSLEDNRRTRGFNDVEKAGAVYFMMKILKPSREEIEKFLTILSVPLNPRTLSRYLGLHAASDVVKRMLVREELSFHSFVLLSRLGEGDTEPLRRVIRELRLGVNYQKELIMLCEDLSVVQGESISDILSRERIGDLIRDEHLSIPARVKHLFNHLRSMRYPSSRELCAAEESMKGKTCEVPAGQ